MGHAPNLDRFSEWSLTALANWVDFDSAIRQIDLRKMTADIAAAPPFPR
jgi:hypothetical protein